MKYCLCIYDIDGKLVHTSFWACRGCAARHMKSGSPCCVRKGSRDGEVVTFNKPYKNIRREAE